ncbi:hypothetical protein [Hydrogenoanaerobacterium sp.]|uniref:hypothetical protein n=1 Tax=Hydrogenoanaerobacterium sp. TaxID=2953763 RepID=UPI00289F9FE6|nr:hypothetical protein [Hydrogenoanaerobacterium sp.]
MAIIYMPIQLIRVYKNNRNRIKVQQDRKRPRKDYFKNVDSDINILDNLIMKLDR